MSFPKTFRCKQLLNFISTNLLDSPDAQPLEPTFIPKLQVYYADFPYLRSLVDQS